MNYLDHAATTPVLPEVREAMAEASDIFGNPSSVHAEGRRARQAVEDARDRIAAAIGASPAEIVFTGGGTEANNLALKGAAAKTRAQGDHLLSTAFEHHSVLDTLEALARAGWELTLVSVDGSGVVEPERVAQRARPGTTVVSVMAVNNEVGTVQPIASMVEAVKEANRATLVHTDAVQALGNVPVDVASWGVDLAAFAGHKAGGPKGVGALFVRAHTPVEPLIHGGGQERGLRSGTLNVAGIVGFGVAAELAAKRVDEKAERLRALRDRLWAGIRRIAPDASPNGDLDRRVAGNLNVSFPGTEGETLLLLLDAAGIACSSGSACSSGALDPSHVLLALGLSPALARGSLRFSLGWSSQDADVDAVLAALPEVLERARRAA
ncbi:MAG TPA: cysteine desulfurase family protein [Actinomycetota bacterium]|nr:cysteine desulfurase family protein [Actinomycetota bacterium]